MIARTAFQYLAITSLFYVVIFCPFYEEPPIFWDEDYHVVFAQKYLNRVFHMEIHPPLGKLLVALGEYLFDYNLNDNQFVGLEQTRATPPGFSLAGYRFFPRLLMLFCAPLLLFLLNMLTGSRMISLLFTLSFMFDNALVVQGRGALLEGMQIFFFLFTLCSATLILKTLKSRRYHLSVWAGVMGMSFAATALIKVTGLILVPVVGYVAFSLLREKSRGMRACLSLVGSFAVTFFIVWQTHFTLARTVNPALPNQGWYGASPAAQDLIARGLSGSISHFPLMLKEYVAFSQDFNAKTRGLNLCMPEETGSSPYLWPIGARSINYITEAREGKTSYWMLQVNPVVWGLGIAGLILGGSCVVGALFFGFVLEKEKLRNMSMLLSLWLFYMGAMLSINRVMYLYHYFLPLVISLILGAIALSEVRLRLPVSYHKVVWRIIGGGYLAILLTSFLFFSPVTYGIPLTEQEFRSRGLLSIWDFRTYYEGLSNYMARPLCDPRQNQKG